jgi:hypothetical protein
MTRQCTICGTTESRRFPRGLCERDYRKLHHRGDLADYPRSTWPADELVAEYEFLRTQGDVRDYRHAAARLGLKPESLRRAIYRAGHTMAEYPA